jgi:hypothetical protein
MKKIFLIICTFFLIHGISAQNLSSEQMEEIASNQMEEFISYLYGNNVSISSSQREQILQINIITQDKINSIKQHPGDVLTEADIQEAIVYRNDFRISRTLMILNDEQKAKYLEFYPSSQLNHINYQL